MYPGVHAKKNKHEDFKHTRRAREDCHECVLSCSTNNMAGTVPHSITNYMANTVSHSMTNNMTNTVTPTVSTWCHEEKRREGPRRGAGGLSPPYKRGAKPQKKGSNQKRKEPASRSNPASNSSESSSSSSSTILVINPLD